jgi:hypothetical protein
MRLSVSKKIRIAFGSHKPIRILSAFLFLLLTTLPAAFCFGADQGFLYLDLKEKREKMENLVTSKIGGIVRVIVYDRSGDISAEGPGFFISPDGKIITNEHIFDQAFSAEVIGIRARYDRVILEKSDNERDLALLKVQTGKTESLTLTSDARLSTGETVYILSITRGLKKTFSSGTVNSGNSDDVSGRGYFVIKKGVSILSYPESIDGVVIDRHGRVAGLTRSVPEESSIFGSNTFTEYSDSFYAVDAETISSFLAETSSAPVEFAPAGAKIFSAWLFSRINRAFVAGFIFFYELGFPRLMAIVIGIIILLVFAEWMIIKLKRLNPFRRDDI